MPPKTISISEFQPTESLRQAAISFLELLQPDDILKIGPIQIWKTELGNLISDGNQRAAVLTEKGVKEIEVDYQEEIPEYLDNFRDIVLERAQALQQAGIFTPYDLLQA